MHQYKIIELFSINSIEIIELKFKKKTSVNNILLASNVLFLNIFKMFDILFKIGIIIIINIIIISDSSRISRNTL